MGEAAGKPNIEWRSAEAALEHWFERDETFESLPAELQTLFQRGRLPVPNLTVDLWNTGSPNWRRQIAQQRDFQTYPGLTELHEAVWEKMDSLDRWRRIASAKPEAHREARDVKAQDEEIANALRELEAAEETLERIAETLGLAWPVPTSAALRSSEEPVSSQSELPMRSGVPGRPTSKHLIKLELERRSNAGETEHSATREAKVLADWLALTHPAAPRVGCKGIQNSLRPQLREAVSKQKNARNEHPK